MIFFTLDRGKTLSQNKIIELEKFDDIKPDDLQEHLNFLFPDGVSKHGNQYVASGLTELNLNNGLIEIIFEFVRRANFKNRPSRMKSIFAFDSIDKIYDFQKKFGKDDSIIWKVESDNYFRADMNLLKLAPSGLIISNNAHAYWSGKAGKENPCWEYLLPPGSKIIEKIQ